MISTYSAAQTASHSLPAAGCTCTKLKRLLALPAPLLLRRAAAAELTTALLLPVWLSTVTGKRASSTSLLLPFAATVLLLLPPLPAPPVSVSHLLLPLCATTTVLSKDCTVVAAKGVTAAVNRLECAAKEPH
jgi:hypothetical protein